MSTAEPSPGPPVRARAIVSGRVQGVWYRETCRRVAEGLGLAGEVANRPDGTVQIDAQGPRPAVDALLRWAWDGPPAARVTGVTIEDLPPSDATGFQVR